MKIVYKEYVFKEINELLDLYRNVGWSNYYENPIMLENAIKNSLYLEAAYFNDELIGLIRVVGDGNSIIYIQDILVKQQYQRKGIGKRLIVDVITKYKNVYQKVLLTDNTEKTKLFYESIGFQEVSSIECISFIKY